MGRGPGRRDAFGRTDFTKSGGDRYPAVDTPATYRYNTQPSAISRLGAGRAESVQRVSQKEASGTVLVTGSPKATEESRPCMS
jgi:hypothetical protein